MRRRVCYLSLEFLMGRLLRNALLNLDDRNGAARRWQRLGIELGRVSRANTTPALATAGLADWRPAFSTAARRCGCR